MKMQQATFPIQMPGGIIVPILAAEIREAIGPGNFDSAVEFCLRKKIDELGEQMSMFEAGHKAVAGMVDPDAGLGGI